MWEGCGKGGVGAVIVPPCPPAVLLPRNAADCCALYCFLLLPAAAQEGAQLQLQQGKEGLASLQQLLHAGLGLQP